MKRKLNTILALITICMGLFAYTGLPGTAFAMAAAAGPSCSGMFSSCECDDGQDCDAGVFSCECTTP